MKVLNLAGQTPFVTKDGSVIRSILDRTNAPVQKPEPRRGAAWRRADRTQRHCHRACEEFYFILEGSGRMEIDGETREVEAGRRDFDPAGRVACHRGGGAAALPLLLRPALFARGYVFRVSGYGPLSILQPQRGPFNRSMHSAGFTMGIFSKLPKISKSFSPVTIGSAFPARAVPRIISSSGSRQTGAESSAASHTIAISATFWRASAASRAGNLALLRSFFLEFREDGSLRNQRLLVEHLLIKPGTNAVRNVSGEQNIRVQDKPHEMAAKTASSVSRPRSFPRRVRAAAAFRENPRGQSSYGLNRRQIRLASSRRGRRVARYPASLRRADRR